MPPVESRGPLLALPFLFGLIGAAAAYGVARRWPGAMRALVVPAALLVVSLLLGTTTPASILLQGGGSAVVAIGWATLRAARGRAALQEGSGRTARATDGRRPARPRPRRWSARRAPAAGGRRGRAHGVAHGDRTPLRRGSVPQPSRRFPPVHRTQRGGAVRAPVAHRRRCAGRDAAAHRHPRQLRRHGLGGRLDGSRRRHSGRRVGLPPGRAAPDTRRADLGRRNERADRCPRGRLDRGLAPDPRHGHRPALRRPPVPGTGRRSAIQRRHRHRGPARSFAGRRRIRGDGLPAPGRTGAHGGRPRDRRHGREPGTGVPRREDRHVERSGEHPVAQAHGDRHGDAHLGGLHRRRA